MGEGKIENVVDDGNFGVLIGKLLLTVGDDCMGSGNFTIVR